MRRLGTVTGDGSSIWGDSAGRYKVTGYSVNYKGKWRFPPKKELPDWKAKRFVSVDVTAVVDPVGTPAHAICYTDRQIEHQVSDLIGPKLRKRFKADAIRIGWSEWGMQEDGRWNFDVGLFRGKRSKKQQTK